MKLIIKYSAQKKKKKKKKKLIIKYTKPNFPQLMSAAATLTKSNTINIRV